VEVNLHQGLPKSFCPALLRSWHLSGSLGIAMTMNHLVTESPFKGLSSFSFETPESEHIHTCTYTHTMSHKRLGTIQCHTQKTGWGSWFLAVHGPSCNLVGNLVTHKPKGIFRASSRIQTLTSDAVIGKWNATGTWENSLSASPKVKQWVTTCNALTCNALSVCVSQDACAEILTPKAMY
jgi:hypothetical protein